MDLETMIALMAAVLYRGHHAPRLSRDEEAGMAEAVRLARRLWEEVLK